MKNKFILLEMNHRNEIRALHIHTCQKTWDFK